MSFVGIPWHPLWVLLTDTTQGEGRTLGKAATCPEKINNTTIITREILWKFYNTERKKREDFEEVEGGKEVEIVREVERK